MTRRGIPADPSRQRRIASNTSPASKNRTNAKPIGGAVAMASFTITKLAAQATITRRAPASARRHPSTPARASDPVAVVPSTLGMETAPVAARGAGAVVSAMGSDAFLLQLERLLVALLGQLQPDEERRQHRERDDDGGCEE